MTKRLRNKLDLIVEDICYQGVCLNTPVSEFLRRVYRGNPPPLPVLSPYHDLPLWELFEGIRITLLDETELPTTPILLSRRYKVLKALYDDLDIMRKKQVFTVADWTTAKREVVTLLTKADGTPQISSSTVALFDGEKKTLNNDVVGPIGRRKLIRLSCVGKNNYLRYVACPLVDSILDAMEDKMGNSTDVQEFISYMNVPVSSAYNGLGPDIMLTTLKKIHFVSVKVKAHSSQLALAFDEALKAGFFLTPLTGYSAIIMAVAGTEVLMGLHTLLPHPTDIEETSPAASRGPRVWMQSASQRLTAMDESIQSDLRTLCKAGRAIYQENIIRTYRSVVYPCAFDFNLIGHRSTFDTVLKKYLQYLVDPICFGILSDTASVATYLDKRNNQCQLVMCNKPLADRYRLPDCPDQFVAKLVVVRNWMLLQRAHTIFDCEVYNYAVHEFKITTQLTALSTSSPNDLNAAPVSTDRAVHTRPMTQSEADSQGLKGNTLITFIYRKFEGQSLDSMPSIAQFVDLMGALIVLHDKEGVYHCDVRRPNIIVKGDSLRLIDYEYCLESETLHKTKKRVPLQLQGIRTAKFFSEDILKNDIKGACSFTERRYVQLLDICSLFYFVGGVQGNLPSDGVEEVIFSNKFNEQFCDFIAREKLKRTKKLRTTSEILQDILQPTPSQETPDWSAVTHEAKRRSWFDGISTYKDFCKSHQQTR